ALLCQIMARTLDEEGYRVHNAPNGQAALVTARQLGPELALVVTDLRMPIMGGSELAGHLARLEPAPRVLFVSGYGFAEEALPGPLLAKPFRPEALVAEVRRLIGSPEPAATSE
ncbi:MAG TPA: response regulator, partial [Gemmatimonadales bacterium]|nr:response regulator [Gemmatimonadales bacterium]